MIRVLLILVLCLGSGVAFAQTRPAGKVADLKLAVEAAKKACLARLAESPEYVAAKQAVVDAEAKQVALQNAGGEPQDRLEAAMATNKARVALKGMEDKAIKSDDGVIAAEKALVAATPVAPRVVYVVDAGGAMMSVFSDMRSQLAKNVSNLTEDTLFGVVVCGDPTAQFFNQNLLPAKIENKKKLDTFMDKVAAKGEANRIVGARAALLLKPDAVWLLTNATWGDALKAKELVSMYKAAHAKINTTVALQEGATEEAERKKQVEFLWNLARDTGGVCVLANGEVLKSPEEMPKPATKPVKTGDSIFDAK